MNGVSDCKLTDCIFLVCNPCWPKLAESQKCSKVLGICLSLRSGLVQVAQLGDQAQQVRVRQGRRMNSPGVVSSSWCHSGHWAATSWGPLQSHVECTSPGQKRGLPTSSHRPWSRAAIVGLTLHTSRFVPLSGGLKAIAAEKPPQKGWMGPQEACCQLPPARSWLSREGCNKKVGREKSPGQGPSVQLVI